MLAMDGYQHSDYDRMLIKEHSRLLARVTVC
jgi:hypothetical protein